MTSRPLTVNQGHHLRSTRLIGLELPAERAGHRSAAWLTDAANGHARVFGFDDDDNALMLMDPATGSSVEYSCSFSTVDCEGLIFTTKNKDPYGRIVATPCD